MATFSDRERAAFTQMRAIAKDERGKDVVVGLTEEETKFYLAYLRRPFSDGNNEDACKFFDLSRKSQLARRRLG